MMKFYRNIDKFPFLLIVFSFIIFFPGFFTYFHQDDFIHLSFSQSVQQVLTSFNIFQRGEFPFYRPIPTQFYFFVNKTLFGLNPFGYHIVNFIIFAVNIFIVYRLIILFTKNKRIAAISTLFFSINSTHFAPLYSAAYVHELFYVMFGILTINYFYLFIKSRRYQQLLISNLFFTLSLMSKETAVILPGILSLIFLLLYPKKNFQSLLLSLLPSIIILSIYFVGHFFFYGLAKGDSYQFILGKSTLNILFWYFLWALSTPNILIDFVGSGLTLNPVFWQVAGFNGYIFFFFMSIFSVTGLILLINFIKVIHIKKDKRVLNYLILGILWFVIGLLPLIVFPKHKLATQQAFSLIGLSLFLGVILDKSITSTIINRKIATVMIICFLIISLNSIYLANKTHWIVRSSQIAKNTIEFINKEYPDLKNIGYIYFKNGIVKIPEYGSSRQVYQALGNGSAISLIYKRKDIRLFFEDVDKPPNSGIDWNKAVIVDSSSLLGY